MENLRPTWIKQTPSAIAHQVYVFFFFFWILLFTQKVLIIPKINDQNTATWVKSR